MQLFYCDKTILNYERKGLFRNIIEYLENPLDKTKNLPTLIAYTWYLYSEGQFVNDEVSSDWQFYLKKWKEMLSLAESFYKHSPQLSFICGYTLEMNGMDFAKDLTYEYKIKNFYDSCKDSKDEAFKAMTEYVISNKNTTILNKYLQELFPNNTTLDNYFKEVLSQ